MADPVADPGAVEPTASIWHRDGRVYIGLGDGLTCIWMSPNQAREWARMLEKRADLADGMRGAEEGTTMASEPERKQ